MSAESRASDQSEVLTGPPGLGPLELQVLRTLTEFPGVSSHVGPVHVAAQRGRRARAFKVLSLLLCGMEVIWGDNG